MKNNWGYSSTFGETLRERHEKPDAQQSLMAIASLTRANTLNGPKRLEQQLMVCSWRLRCLDVRMKFEKHHIINNKLTERAIIISIFFYELLCSFRVLPKQSCAACVRERQKGDVIEVVVSETKERGGGHI
jgi:hypothetical protein